MAAAELPHAATPGRATGWLARHAVRLVGSLAAVISISMLYYVMDDSNAGTTASMTSAGPFLNHNILPQALAGDVSDFLGDYSSDSVASASSDLSAHRLPDVIIIGARKCGTRALLQYMAMHPGIAARRGREVHYFDNDRHFARGPRWYVKQMPLATADQLVVEKTPGYFHESSVPRRVCELLPGVKLILVVRDPVVRAVSDYTQLSITRNFRGRPYETFENVVLSKNGQVNGKNYVVMIGKYALHLNSWLQYFLSEQIHVVDGEKLAKQPWAEMYKIEQFLNLTHFLDESHFYFSASKGFYCPFVHGEVKCLGPTKGRQHPAVDPAVLNKLSHFYKPSNDRFCDLVGVNFSWCHVG